MRGISKTDRLQRELRGELPIEGLVPRQTRRPYLPEPGWITLAEASRLLGTSATTLSHHRRNFAPSFRMKPLSPTARTGRSVGLAVCLADVKRLQTIRKRCGVGIKATFKIFGALAKDGPL